MNKGISLSVLMPVFNAQQYIGDAIESVLAQSFSDFELLIIDDGSTDDSLKIIKRYAENDIRIKYFNRENRGLVFTLNELVGIASADIIARMDADDTIAPERFSEQMDIVKNNDDNIICGSWVKTTNYSNETWHYRQADNFTKNLLALGITPLCHASLMCYKKLLQDNPFQEQFEYLEDYALFCQLAAECKVIFYNIPKVLYFYNIHPDSICGQKIAEQALKRIPILRKYISALIGKNVDFQSCSDFLMINALTNITLAQFAMVEEFLADIVRSPHFFGDEYYALSEHLLNLALKCEQKESALNAWEKSVLHPSDFCFLKGRFDA